MLAGSAKIPWRHDAELALAILLYSPTQYPIWIPVSATRMTPSWMEASVSYLHDTLMVDDVRIVVAV
ncbi:MAG: hypothetical protein ACEY3L_17365 [Wolbachia sp.]